MGKKEILDDMKMVAERINTAKSVHQLITKTGVEMPISEQIFQVLFEDKFGIRANRPTYLPNLGVVLNLVE